jgi:hypothetical protein
MQVTVLTITNSSRYNELELLLLNILEQTVKIKELIILESEYIPDLIEKNKQNIHNLYNKYENRINFKMMYYIHQYDLNLEYVTPLTETQLFAIGNEKASGDIIFRMLDDTYYFSNYIEENYNLLSKSNKLFNYCSKVFIYDSILNVYVKTDALDKMLFCSMIYKKEFINSEAESNINVIDNNVMEDINCLFIKIVSLVNFEIYRNAYFEKLFVNQNINVKLSDRYLFKYDYDIYCPYDIVYLNGLHTISWDPEDKSLGGSEQALVKLSEEWVEKSNKVAVYGNFKFMKKTITEVDYYNISLLPLHNKFKNLISWRSPGLILLSIFNLRIDNLLIDFHDNFSYTLEKLNIDMVINILEKANYIMLKSEYHKTCFEDFLIKYNKKLENPKLIVSMNGLRINDFNNKPKGIIRKPYRFCYCSSYDRGLAVILKNIWPHIYNKEPTSELHIYYGMDHIYDEDSKKILTFLMGQPGVMDHGRKPLETIIEEKYTSSFHIYITNCEAEIDCISIRESLITGCIPIIYDTGVFKERDGIKYSNELNEENCKIIAEDIVFKMRNQEIIKKCSNAIKTSKTICDWESVAITWLKYII